MERVTLQDQIAEVRREIEMRKRVYIRQVDKGKLTAGEAERRTVAMVGVLLTLEELREMQRDGSACADRPLLSQSIG